MLLAKIVAFCILVFCLAAPVNYYKLRGKSRSFSHEERVNAMAKVFLIAYLGIAVSITILIPSVVVFLLGLVISIIATYVSAMTYKTQDKRILATLQELEEKYSNALDNGRVQDVPKLEAVSGSLRKRLIVQVAELDR